MDAVRADIGAGIPGQVEHQQESALQQKISELSEELLRIKAQHEELKAELERERRTSQLNSTYSTLIHKVTSTVLPVLNNAYEIAGRQCKQFQHSQEFSRLLQETATAIALTQTAASSRLLLDKGEVEEDETPFVNPIDTHYQNLENNRAFLLELYNVHLKPTNNYPIKDIVGCLKGLNSRFSEAKERIKESQEVLLDYIQKLRKWIDHRESNRIPSHHIASIAEHDEMRDDDKIVCLPFEVPDTEKIVEAKLFEIAKHIENSNHVNKVYKERHDKMLKQYFEFESLIAKIELRLQKLSHHVTAQPSMLELERDTLDFQSRLNKLTSLISQNQGINGNFYKLKLVLHFLIEYNGNNPLKDEKFSDPNFLTKLQTVEQQLKEADIKFQDDAEYCSYKDGTAPLPTKGLAYRALEMTKTYDEADFKLQVLLVVNEKEKKMKTILHGMEFYDKKEEAEVKKKEEVDFTTELNEIKSLSDSFNEVWKQLAELYSKTLFDSLNKACSSVMTNKGNKRSETGLIVKGFAGLNTIYVLPPFTI